MVGGGFAIIRRDKSGENQVCASGVLSFGLRCPTYTCIIAWINGWKANMPIVRLNIMPMMPSSNVKHRMLD